MSFEFSGRTCCFRLHSLVRHAEKFGVTGLECFFALGLGESKDLHPGQVLPGCKVNHIKDALRQSASLLHLERLVAVKRTFWSNYLNGPASCAIRHDSGNLAR